MSRNTAAILGSTGMIGTYLLEQLLTSNAYETIRLLVRRPMAKPDPRMEIKLVDFNDTESLRLALEETDVLFSAMGTTQKNVKGDKVAYRRIDLEIPVKTARLAFENGCRKMVIVSSVKASASSSSFYLKLKGELELELEKIGFSALHIMQPSMLLGDRQESRPMERVLQGTFRLINPVCVGGLRKFRGIEGRELAEAMIAASRLDKEGVFRYEYDGIKRLSE